MLSHTKYLNKPQSPLIRRRDEKIDHKEDDIGRIELMERESKANNHFLIQVSMLKEGQRDHINPKPSPTRVISNYELTLETSHPPT